MASRKEGRKREGSFPRGSDSMDKGEKRKTKNERKERKEKGRKEKKNGGELCLRREGKIYFLGVLTVPLSSAGYIQAANPHLGS